jgi:hypothetical protein
MSLPQGYSIVYADSTMDLQNFARLALEYSQWLGVDLGFQVKACCFSGLNSLVLCCTGADSSRPLLDALDI